LDANAIVDTYSRQPGLLTIGTDPDEWCEGFEAASALWRVQFQELEAREIKQQVDVQELVAWREGTVGWIACQVRAAIEGRGPFLGRMTAVLREEGLIGASSSGMLPWECRTRSPLDSR